MLQNAEFWIFDAAQQRLLDRVCAEGEPSRIMEIFPHVKSDYQEPLASALLKRETLPVDEAAEAIGGRQEGVVDLSAHVLGRAGSEAKSHGEKVAAAIRVWRERWDDRRREQKPYWGDHPVESLTPCLCRLMWAAGRLGAAGDELIKAAAAHADDFYFRPIRLEAIRALARQKANKAILEVLESAAVGHDPEVRAAAAQVLAEQDAKRAAAVSGKLLSDRVSLERLALAEGVDITPAVHSAAENVHYQGVALPVLIAAEDLEHLKTIAQNPNLPEAARLGAIEALARLGQEPAEDLLASIGKNENEEDDFRKAAWRARRRSQRRRLQTSP